MVRTHLNLGLLLLVLLLPVAGEGQPHLALESRINSLVTNHDSSAGGIQWSERI
jgi:hypothetical protein